MDTRHSRVVFFVTFQLTLRQGSRDLNVIELILCNTYRSRPLWLSRGGE